MPIDFPANPTNGQVYGNWIFDSSITAWRNVNTDTGIGTLNAMGLKNVVPTSVAVGSGSATTNANGTVTFSGATSISLNGVFSSTYNNYRIITRITYDAARQGQFRMRSAGTDNTSAVYFSNGYFQNGTGALSTYQAQNDTKGFIGEGTTDTSYSLDIFSPFLTNLTRTVTLCSGIISSLPANHNLGCLHSSSSSFDGISLFPGTGSMSGTISVYGYTN
jgi:hypothetical protein